jgi:hypothetical protein
MSQNKSLTLLSMVAVVLLVSAVKIARAQDDDSMTLAVVERATTDVVTDTGEKGDTVGDVLTFANEVYDQKNETMVGTDQGFCVRTVVGKAWECIWTLTLKEGQLTVEGPFYDASPSTLAITGGTGKYRKASGQMNLKARDEKGTEYDFIYEIDLD